MVVLVPVLSHGHQRHAKLIGQDEVTEALLVVVRQRLVLLKHILNGGHGADEK